MKLGEKCKSVVLMKWACAITDQLLENNPNLADSLSKGFITAYLILTFQNFQFDKYAIQSDIDGTTSIHYRDMKMKIKMLAQSYTLCYKKITAQAGQHQKALKKYKTDAPNSYPSTAVWQVD